MQSGSLTIHEYQGLTDEELDLRISAALKRVREKVLLLGHHYQRESIIQFADEQGDSFRLAQLAAESDAEFIIFCGVHFMAEAADILTSDDQKVIMPNTRAGCSMADMANVFDVEDAWAILSDLDPDSTMVPVTYMNSAANLKAFCGENGGIVCTSSNARGIFDWAFERGEKVLFFPDEHLGRTVALEMGLTPDDLAIYDPRLDEDEQDIEGLQRAKVILWKGWCSVHARFTLEQVNAVREMHPGAKVIVHPECERSVVEAADAWGSTGFIIRWLEEQTGPGDVVAIGTEINLVSRLAKRYPDRTIMCLNPIVCPCSTMYMIHPSYLAMVLENLAEGHIVNQIIVDETTATNARIALERMLAIKIETP